MVPTACSRRADPQAGSGRSADLSTFGVLILEAVRSSGGRHAIDPRTDARLVCLPETPAEQRANFRLVVDVRYISKDGAFSTEHVVMPSLDSYWECDKDKRGEPNYVRGEDDGPFSTFNMQQLDDWERLILLVKAESIHSFQVKVFDVNREDVWNRLKDVVGQVVQAVLGFAKNAYEKLPAPVPALSGDALGSASDDLVSHLLKRLGNGDKILFRGAAAGHQHDRDPR